MGVVLALVTLLFAAIVFACNRLTGGRDEGGALMTADASTVSRAGRPGRRDADHAEGQPR